MPIKVGDRLPEAKFRVMTSDGPVWKTTDDVFKGKKVALFGVVGAFTGTCHGNHLPSYLKNYDAFRTKSVDTIAVTSVNDFFVMDAWKKAAGAEGKIEFLSDGNADFVKAIGMNNDATAAGFGLRSQRYSMLVDDGVVKQLNVEPEAGKVQVSGGDTLLKQI